MPKVISNSFSPSEDDPNLDSILDQPPACSPAPLLWTLVLPLAILTLAGSISISLFRSIQTYRYYDWTILPVTDIRIEAACGELVVYYLPWQNPKTEKPIAHVINPAVLSNCTALQRTPTPASRFPGLNDQAVLTQLGCMPEGRKESAKAWNCTKPIGKLLRAEMEADSSQTNRQ